MRKVFCLTIELESDYMGRANSGGDDRGRGRRVSVHRLQRAGGVQVLHQETHQGEVLPQALVFLLDPVLGWNHEK